MMEKNIGKTDKIIRGIFALVFAVLGYIYSPWLYILSALLIFTIATEFCMIYKLIGIKTCKIKKK